MCNFCLGTMLQAHIFCCFLCSAAFYCCCEYIYVLRHLLHDCCTGGGVDNVRLGGKLQVGADACAISIETEFEHVNSISLELNLIYSTKKLSKIESQKSPAKLNQLLYFHFCFGPTDPSARLFAFYYVKPKKYMDYKTLCDSFSLSLSSAPLFCQQ